MRIIVWFSGNFEWWSLSLKLPRAFSCRQCFTNKIFWRMMKSYSFSLFVSYICFSIGAFKKRKLLSLLLFLEILLAFCILNIWSCPHIGRLYIKLELSNESIRKVFNKCFGVKCLIFARSPIPCFSFFFSWLKCKSQSRCSLIKRSRYLTCVFRKMYWPLILKCRSFAIFLLELGLNSKISCFTRIYTLHKKLSFPLRISSVNVIKSAVSCAMIDFLFVLSHVMRSFES